MRRVATAYIERLKNVFPEKNWNVLEKALYIIDLLIKPKRPLIGSPNGFVWSFLVSLNQISLIRLINEIFCSERRQSTVCFNLYFYKFFLKDLFQTPLYKKNSLINIFRQMYSYSSLSEPNKSELDSNWIHSPLFLVDVVHYYLEEWGGGGDDVY